MMARPATGAALVLACACLAGTVPHAASQARPGEQVVQKVGKPDTGGIRGCVVAADTGGPLREAAVQATATALGVVRSTWTDALGCYVLSNLPASRYVVQVSKLAYARLEYGEDPLLRREGQSVKVPEGKIVEGVDFRLPKAGIITGRVVDQAGEPVAGVLVQAMSVVPGGVDEPPRAFPHAPSARTTNDLGRYRLFGLPAGEYYLVASPVFKGSRKPAEPAGFVPTYTPSTSDVKRADLKGFIPTCFPSTSDLAAATVLLIAPGVELHDVDIVMAPATATRK